MRAWGWRTEAPADGHAPTLIYFTPQPTTGVLVRHTVTRLQPRLPQAWSYSISQTGKPWPRQSHRLGENDVTSAVIGTPELTLLRMGEQSLWEGAYGEDRGITFSK